jgi:hypothetical protein
MGSSIRLLLSTAAYEYATNGCVFFRPFVFVGWEMPPVSTRHALRGTVKTQGLQNEDGRRSVAVPPFIVLPAVPLPAPEPAGREPACIGANHVR